MHALAGDMQPTVVHPWWCYAYTCWPYPAVTHTLAGEIQLVGLYTLAGELQLAVIHALTSKNQPAVTLAREMQH